MHIILIFCCSYAFLLKGHNVLREHNISSATFYKWRSRYGGMDLPMISKLKELEAENIRLKKMYAEERLKADILKEVLEKK